MLRLRLEVSNSVLFLGSGGIHILARGHTRCAKITTAKQGAHRIKIMAHQFRDKINFQSLLRNIIALKVK